MHQCPEDPPRLELAHVTKRYPGVIANDGIDLRVLPGEIHAVLGENGAGKSTLMKIIYGVVHADRGVLRWNGQGVDIASPADARRLGIAMVFQHFSLFETLSVAENIALALRPDISRRDLAQRIRDTSARYGLPLDPARPVHTMSVGERQRVEIVRCLLQSPKCLILDEPTSVLTPAAVGRLFETLRQLAHEGCSVLYISHKLEEIRALCDRATILRGGRVVASCDPRTQTAAALARLMTGGDIPHPRHRTAQPSGDPVLSVRDLSRPADDPFGTPLREIAFELRAGEILGIAGISGNGQRELAAALSGETPAAPEAIRLDGHAIGASGVAERRARGLVAVPEERLGRGAVPDLDLVDNTILTSRSRFSRLGFINRGAARREAAAILEAFSVKAAGADADASSLSGGNLQKFIVGREIRGRPTVLVAAQPTWGVDVAASAQIRQALIDLRDAGSAVLVVSEEIEELFEIADRIAVMSQGRLSEAVPASETDPERIGLLMSATVGAIAAAA